ncbi:zinc-binding dehydrogenase [Annulohypoxylon nitens]|nr:zinc-binding dehydrogenase [Annulohypoxylon nitens]
MTSPKRLPNYQCAIQQGDDGKARLVNNAAIPTLPPGYVLIKTSAVAINPTDYKILQNFPVPGAYVGIDFCGTVVQAADDVDLNALKLGTMVSGCSFSFTTAHRLASGAFAEYVRARADLLLRMNPSHFLEGNTMSATQAATLGISVSTCCLALWSPEGLGLQGTPDTPNISEKRASQVLVYGGSTATGTIAIQLLKLSGYDPIATCSPRNFDLVRGRGASAVFDYSIPDVAARIKLHTGGRLKYALDCISNADSVLVCYEAIQRPGGRYVSLEYVPDDLLAKRKAVRPNFVFAGEIFGEEIELGDSRYDRPPNKVKHEFMVSHIGMLQRLLDSGRLRAHPTEVLGGGLQGILRGLEVLASGKISGKKLVAVVE